MSELKYDGNGNVISVPKLDRPLKWTFGHERKLRDVPEQWNQLGMLDVALEVNDREKLLIVAYLRVWLGRFVFPNGEEFVKVGTFKAAAQMAIGVTYSLVPPILACIYHGLGQLTKMPKGSWVHATETPPFLGHYLYAWIGLHFTDKTFAARYEAFLPMVRQFRGILNAYQPWELEVTDCRAVLRGDLSSDDFCWTLVPLPTHPEPRVDDGQRRADTLDFMVSIKAGYVVLRQEGRFTKKSYNPHRFARQHGFQQRLPGRHVKLPHGGEVLDLYRFWLSLTRVHSTTFLHIPSVEGGVASRVDPAYVKWWNEEFFPSIFAVSIQFLKASEARNFIPSLMKSTVIRPQGKGKQLQHYCLPHRSEIMLMTLVHLQRSRNATEVLKESQTLYNIHFLHLLPEIFNSPELRGLSGDVEIIGALDDFLKTNTLEILGSLPTQIDGGVLSLNIEALQLYFRMDVDPLLKTMDAYLSKVNLYLAKRDEVSTSLDVEERDKSLATVQKGISLNQIIHDSLSKEINEFTKKKGSLESKIESLKKELESIKQQHSDVTSTLDLHLDKRLTAEEQLQSNQAKLIELENSKVVAVETVAEVERMRQDLENFEHSISKTCQILALATL
ncbi:hypothetical protein SLEP1_g43761 [Rubroshorea leprosula]|uniref:Aminotransferase-like plant mobile domain-containing protein n=1 Tax=Rubroshorea leprosula TaxID=152421 RepID=A0AAV5LE21_9ROSI|nr:hypothetical protein SLEP1_g43761 [Rubroshorea leprosula]